MTDEIQIGKLSKEEKKKHKKDIDKIKKELAEEGFDAEVVNIKKIKKKTAEHNIKMNEDMKTLIDNILDGAQKSELKEKGADQIVHAYDEYDKSAPYVSLIYKMTKVGPKGQEQTVEKVGIKKGGEIFEVEPIRRFFLKSQVNRAEDIRIEKKK